MYTNEGYMNYFILYRVAGQCNLMPPPSCCYLGRYITSLNPIRIRNHHHNRITISIKSDTTKRVIAASIYLEGVGVGV